MWGGVSFGQKLVFVSAVVDQFRFGVQAGQFFSAENDVFLCCAQVASFCSVVVGGSKVEDFPVDGEVGALVFQFPDVFAQFSLVAVSVIAEGLFMVSKSCFEGVFCHSHVRFLSIFCCYCGLVDEVFFEALILQWAGFLFSAVARFFCGAVPCFLRVLFLKFPSVC